MRVSDRALMEMQAEALFTHDPDGRIRWTNEPGENPAPRFFLGRTLEGNLWHFRYDLPDDVVSQLEALARAEPVAADLRVEPANLDAFRAVLRGHAAIQGEFFGPAYHFPDALPVPANVVMIGADNAELVAPFFADVPDLQRELHARQPCAVVVEEGIMVSVCFSARMTLRAAEAGVETLPKFRGRGYAPLIVAGWARAVRALGRLPLYSTSWDNHASQSVARKLGLVLYGADLSIR